MDEAIILEAKEFAINAHGDQKYAKFPYRVHLEHVVEVLGRFQYDGRPELIISAWLHDTVEDTDVTLEIVEQKYGPVVRDIVYRLTDEEGSCRRERKFRTYPKVRGHRDATIVKLCDRIANMEASFVNLEKFTMYRGEYPEFRENLYVPGMAEGLWSYLEFLYKKALGVDQERPQGFAKPLTPEYQSILKQIESGERSQGVMQLEKYPPQNFEQKLWALYMRSLAWEAEEQVDRALMGFFELYTEAKAHPEQMDRSLYRLLCANLSHLSSYHRSQREFERAFALESIRLDYCDRYSSYSELHDAHLGLHTTALGLSDYRICELHLRKSIEVGEKIQGRSPQLKALACSHAELGKVLGKLKRFEEGEAALEKSIELLQTHEADYQNVGEVDLVRSFYELGQFYEAWYHHLEGGPKNKKWFERKEKAVAAYDQALEEASKRNLKAVETNLISEARSRLV